MPAQHEAPGIETVASPYSVDQTVERLTQLLESKAIKLFALIDHSGEAERAGFAMQNTKLIIFGNPAAGTPVMLAAPLSAIDLPLKILVSQQPDGSSTISWNDPGWLQQRHNIWPQLVPNISAVEGIVRKALA